MWIKIGVESITPMMLVTLRVSFGLLALLVVMAVQRQAFPRDRATIMKFVFMGVFNTVIPFLLITWGETKIDSSLASILNAATPLFVIIIAHFWLHDEKITPAAAGRPVDGLCRRGGAGDAEPQTGQRAERHFGRTGGAAGDGELCGGADLLAPLSARHEAGGAVHDDPGGGHRPDVDHHAGGRSARWCSPRRR